MMTLRFGERIVRKVALVGMMLACASLLAVSLAVAAAPSAHAAATTSVSNPFKNIPVHGAGANGSRFAGMLDVTDFSTNGSQLFANGTLSGTVYQGSQAVGTVSQAASFPVTRVDNRVLPQNASSSTVLPAIDPSCNILSLSLGAINLNLLGLVVTTNQINLDITAQSGAGNLLGNLLCDVANLLNNGGTLSTLLANLTTTLNQILAQLGL